MERSMMTLRVAAASALLAATAASAHAAAPAQQVHMQKALAALQDAKTELGLAERDKGGHRQIAANLVSEAIAEVKQGIAFRAEAPARQQTRQPRR
jgi:hypothetical protein